MTPARGPFTTFLHDVLKAAGDAAEPAVLLGDGIAPEGAGWLSGQPGTGRFVPYGVLKTLSASPTRQQSVRDPGGAWDFPYQITGWGTLREQADYINDVLTTAAGAIGKVRGDDSPVPGFGIAMVVVTALGPVDRTDQVSPPLWTRTDSILLRVARA